MASTYISSIASMLRNFASPSRPSSSSPSPAPGVAIYSGVIGTINVTNQEAAKGSNNTENRSVPEVFVDDMKIDSTTEPTLDNNFGQVGARNSDKDAEAVRFARPLQGDIPFARTILTESIAFASAMEKAEKLALFRRRRLARIEKQRAEGGRRWNRVLRNRLSAGL